MSFSSFTDLIRLYFRYKHSYIISISNNTWREINILEYLHTNTTINFECRLCHNFKVNSIPVQLFAHYK